MQFDDRSITHAEFLAESIRWANLFLAQPPSTPDGVLHVGVLLDNTPDYLFALGGAALSRSVVVGLNHTRRDEHLWRDIEHTHVGLVITEPRHLPLLAPIVDRLPLTLVADQDLASAVAAQNDEDPGIEPDVSSRWALIFTSGTSSAPKAVICTQRRLLQTGVRMAAIMDLGPDDIGYVCMPLFHSNALMVGWAPSIAVGASVALARKFSASSWLDDVRRYRATYFNYTGKPLSYLVATPEQADDARELPAGCVRQRRLTRSHRDVRPPVRCRGDRCVRCDRRRHRRQSRRRHEAGLGRQGRRHGEGRRPRRQRAAAGSFRLRRCARQRRRVRGRDRQHRRRGPVRGLLQQRRSHGVHAAGRLVLVGRPRLRRRRRLLVLRRPHRRLAAGRR